MLMYHFEVYSQTREHHDLQHHISPIGPQHTQHLHGGVTSSHQHKLQTTIDNKPDSEFPRLDNPISPTKTTARPKLISPQPSVPVHKPLLFARPKLISPQPSVPQHKPLLFARPKLISPQPSVPQHKPLLFARPKLISPQPSVPQHKPLLFARPKLISPQPSVPQHKPLLFARPKLISPQPSVPQHKPLLFVPTSCSFPDIDAFDLEVMSLTKTFPVLNCSSGIPSIVKVQGDELVVDVEKAQASRVDVSSITCRYQSHVMTPGQDFKTTLSNWSHSFDKNIKLKPDDEHLIVECRKRNSKQLVAKSYFSIVREINLSDHFSKQTFDTNTKGVNLNVLIVGIDGMSRSQMIRSMPKTKKLLAQTSGVFEFKKHNKVGMNTFPNVIPLLTGMRAEDHPSWNSQKPMDLFHFIWEDFERAGYTTQLVLDKKKITAFHNSKIGWTKPPVMLYNRPTIVASESDPLVRSVDENCIGDTPEVTLLTDYQLQLVNLSQNNRSNRTRPFFSYSFFVRLTHDDYNKASAGDELYHSFFHKLITQRLLNNTIVLFFSDHGPRFGPVRRTMTGMLEGPNPFCFLVVPPWILQKHPRIRSALSVNQDLLTTNFDLHQTLKDVLDFSGEGKSDRENPSPGANQPGSSLFREISPNRTCPQAGVEITWCSCNRLTRLDSKSKMVGVIADQLVAHINGFTAEHRSLCLQLTVKTVRFAFKVQSQEPGFQGVDLYKIAMETTPGGAVYEGLIQYLGNSNGTRVIGALDRLNMFQTQAKCMKYPELKPFCFCQGVKR